MLFNVFTLVVKLEALLSNNTNEASKVFILVVNEEISVSPPLVNKLLP